MPIIRGFTVVKGLGCFLLGSSRIDVTLLRRLCCYDGHGLSFSTMAFREHDVVELMPCVIHWQVWDVGPSFLLWESIQLWHGVQSVLKTKLCNTFSAGSFMNYTSVLVAPFTGSSHGTMTIFTCWTVEA